ncbi:MAG TPA: PHP domain-containing protein [Pseudosphingobacterium sp.]|nr:PHP domain-containing protein [Pseudosphingobacterium sp.]
MFLNVHSHFSLRYGTMSIESLVAEAKSFGIKDLVLTDINNSTGCMPFIMKCREEGLRPLIGIEFRKERHFLYVGIAKNKEGMKELNDFLSYYNLTQQDLPDTPPPLSMLILFIPLKDLEGTYKQTNILV